MAFSATGILMANSTFLGRSLGALAHHVREGHPASVWLSYTCVNARYSMTFSLMKRLND